MKIISKFSDYYDSGIAYGIDENLRFKRETTEIDDVIVIVAPSVISYRRDGKNIRAVVHFKLIGFCGKIYPMVHISLEEVLKKDKALQYKFMHEAFLYSYDKVEDFFHQYVMPIKDIKVGMHEHLGFRYGFSIEFNTRIQEFFAHNHTRAKTLFEKYHTPYFLCEELRSQKKNGNYESIYKCRLLPCLKDFRFVQVKEPIEAFQEISMYLGSLASREDNTIMIEDKYLAQAKGFDCYSFKKLPEKKDKKEC